MIRMILIAVVALIAGAAASAVVVIDHQRSEASALLPDSSAVGDSIGLAALDSLADEANALVQAESQKPAAPVTGQISVDSAEALVARAAESAARATAAAIEQQRAELAQQDSSALSAIEPDRMAKIFATMEPRDAARVLEQMTDEEIEVVLGHLGNRQAAAILSNLTAERAAAIGRAAIRGNRASL